MVTRIMPYQIVAYGITDLGRVRQRNEDFWGMLPDQKFFVIADGMGGHQAGDLAAMETVKELCEVVKNYATQRETKPTLDEIADFFIEAIQHVNLTIWTLGSSRQNYKGMGTTLCSIQFNEDGAVLSHVGDSRIYRIRKKKISQMTKDHSLLRELLDMGQLSEHQADEFYYKNIITKAVGTEPYVEPTVEAVTMLDGDIFLMCTDGLTDALDDVKIQKIVNSTKTVEEGAKKLIDEANASGGNDNITVVLMQVHQIHENEDLPG